MTDVIYSGPMPIQVDHAQQRVHVTDLARRLVADEGVSALTFRAVAQAGGTSTAIVSTYFSDKRDLLLSTLRAAATRTSERFDAATAAGGNLQDCLEAWLPLDDDRLTDLRVVVAFWGVAASDPELAAVQDGHVRRARGRVERILSQRPGQTGTSSGNLARQIVALTLGIALQAVFEAGEPAARRQRTLLADGLDRLCGKSVRRR
jgi:TetR/AcrR family transcriptional regulator, transcriptional repressor of bet genes